MLIISSSWGFPTGPVRHQASKLIGRYDGLTGVTWFEGVGKTSFDLLDFYFWASKRKKVDKLHACISIYRAKKSILNNVNKY
jgi:hypothetical protein